MTLDQLKIFVAVAECQHVTRAADELGMTQSAVSSALGALEGRHGVRLLDRVGRGVVLNEVGRVFLQEAKAVLARAAAAEATLDDLGTLHRGRLAIHASQTIASYWLPKRLVRFQAQYPGVQLDVRIGNTQEAADAVREGAAELGFVEGELEDPMLVDETVGADELVLLVQPTHPWVAAPGLRATDLTLKPWVLRESGSGTRSTLEAFLRSEGADPAELVVALTLPSNEAVLAAAEAGAGATALSRQVAAGAIARGALVVAPLQLPSRIYRLLRHRERYRTRAGETFVAMATAPEDAR